MDLCAAFDRFGRELRGAKREGRRPRRQFGAPRFKSRRRATSVFALWNDQFAVTNHFRFDASPRATMRVPLLGAVRLREAVPGVGGILGCRVSERRGRWFASFQFDTDWVDGERSDKSEAIAREGQEGRGGGRRGASRRPSRQAGSQTGGARGGTHPRRGAATCS